MMILELFRWWYGQGWRLVFQHAGQRLVNIGNDFSVGTLLRTLFAPWRRIMTYPGSGLDAHLRAMVDNLVSRCVGFFVRMSVLIAVIILGIVVLLVGVIQVIVWPLIPLVIIAAPLKGLVS